MKIDWKYTFGEILIVIIGITIAFNLNNWKDKRTNKNQLIEYNESLVNDLILDTIQLSDNLRTLNQHLQIIYSTFGQLQNKTSARDSIMFSIFSIMPPVEFFPNNATYQAMINSGDLSLIKDLSLKSDIVNNYNRYSALDDVNDLHGDVSLNRFNPYVMENLNYAEMRTVNDKMRKVFDDPYFHNIIYTYFGVVQTEINAYNSALLRCKTLLEKIKV